MSEHTAENDEPRITEAEWRRNEAKRECSTYGHDWNVVQRFDGTPIALTCERQCGTPVYRVIPPEELPEPDDDHLPLDERIRNGL